jgi:hypothetical protein
MTRKEIRPVGRHVAADLEHDLVAVVQRERARVAAAERTVHVQADTAAKAEQPSSAERRSPDAEQRAESRPALESDDSRRVERPEPCAAPRPADPDPRRDDDHASVREELEMHSQRRVVRGARAGGEHRGFRVVRGTHADRCRHERKHRLHGIALVALVVLVAGCGGGSGGSPTISIQPARQFRLHLKTVGPAVAGRPTQIAFEIIQPDGKPLTRFKTGSGPHTGVHLIMVRRDLATIVHRHPPVHADGRFTDTVVFPDAGPYRIVVDVYPQQTTPQPNFQLFSSLHVKGPYTPKPLPVLETTQTVDGFRFTLHGRPRLRAIQAGFLKFDVTGPNGKPTTFTPWYGALAHAIFFRAGTLDYFHTHVCAAGANGCTSVLGATKVTGSSTTPGKLDVGVLVPVAGTWRLFLQSKPDGRLVTVGFTLQVR